MQICSIDSTPLLKILLHAAKYPALAINGLLLGTVSSDRGRALKIVDAVPLCHGQLHLAMAIETALLQISEYAKNRELQVLGLYHANEAIDDRQLGSGPRTIADKLQQKCSPHAVALLVDNRLLSSFLKDESQTFLQMYVRQEGAAVWGASSTKVSIAASNLAQLYSTCVGSGRHRQLADFDDHLDDLTRDWTNVDISA